jgi:hypothetical protein
MGLTTEHQAIYDRALKVKEAYHQAASDTIEVLRDAERTLLYKQLGKSSLFLFATDIMELDEPIAYVFIAVARKTNEIPELKKAIAEHKLTIPKANRIISTLTRENAKELVTYAASHSWRETEREVARRNPLSVPQESVRYISDTQVQIMAVFDLKEYEVIKRSESLIAKNGKKANLRTTILANAQFHIDKKDPVKKAERAAKRKKKLCAPRETDKPTAEQLNIVNLRDQGRCTHLDENGKRCNSDRWTETHHIIKRSEGGSNEPENLTTLCSFHHDMVHGFEKAKWRRKSSSKDPPKQT